MKKCEYCWEEIQDSAKKCKHCWEWLEEWKLNKEAEIKNIKIETNKKDKLWSFHDVRKATTIIVVITIAIIFWESWDIWSLIIYSLFVIWIWWLFNLWSKEKNSKAFKRRSILWTWIWLIIFFLFIWKSYYLNTYTENEINSIINSWYITTNWEFKFNNNIDINTEWAKKIKELLKFLSDNKIDNTIELFEEKMYNDDILLSKKNIEESLYNHDKLISILELYSNEYIKSYSNKYKELFWNIPQNIEKIKQNIDKTVLFRIPMYKSSRELYKFYLENYDNIQNIDWELVIWDEIYDEYEKLYNDTISKQEQFENIRTWLIDEANKNLNK